MKGINKKILKVDLSKKDFKETKINNEVYEKFFGGLGLGIKYLYNKLEKNIDPLGPKNILGFVPGLFNSSTIPLSARFSVVSKSPLTQGWGNANCGGFLGPEIKQAGYDGVFLKGISEDPVFLLIKDEDIELRDARDLWGLDTARTIDELKEKLGNQTRIACIGPAGEKKSLISCIIHDYGRAAARSGLGAVMGSKKLKAVVVEGENQILGSNNSELNKKTKKIHKKLNKNPSRFFGLLKKITNPLLPYITKLGLHRYINEDLMIKSFKRYGTSVSTAISVINGDAPIKNWKGTKKDFSYRQALKISEENLVKYQENNYNCRSCPIACGGIINTPKGPYKTNNAHKPEYETLAAFGSLNLNDNIESIIKCNEICNKYGIDTISTGTCVSFALEAQENNLIKKKRKDKLEWGNEESIVKLTEEIAKKEGLGKNFSDGVKSASSKIGNEAEKFAMDVGGQEVPMHDPRNSLCFGLAYESNPSPARHTKGGAGYLELGFPVNPFSEINLPDIKNSGLEQICNIHAKSIWIQTLLDSLGLCFFLSYFGKYPIIELFNNLTELKFDEKTFLIVGKRIHLLEQCFNLREEKEFDYSLPKRIKKDVNKNSQKSFGKSFEEIKKIYNEKIGLKENRFPRKEILKDLDLKEAIKDFY